MQGPDGMFTAVSRTDVERMSKKETDRVLHVGEEIDNVRGSPAVVIESIGRRFVRVRTKPGRHFNCKVGQELTVKKCAFKVVAIQRGKRMLLEGIPA